MRWIKKIIGTIPNLIFLLIFLSFVVLAIFARQLAPQDPSRVSLATRLLPPSWAEGGDPRFFLGTDDLGRDIWSRIIYGSQVSISIGLLVAILSGVIGTTLGLVSGYYKALDILIMRLCEIQLAFPSMLLALAVAAVVGRSYWNIVLILSFTGWVGYTRIVRAQVLSLRTSEYIVAAQTLNVGQMRILFRHLLPNLFGSVLTISSAQIAGAILSEASLTFLGLGMPLSIPTWGAMLHDGQGFIESAWWMSVFPGLCIVLLVLSINILGDFMRDRTDPRLSAKRGR